MTTNQPTTRERIMLGGVPGTGKTYAWATMARMLSENKFYVIDPDDGVRRVLYEVDEKTKERIFPDLSNIEYYFTPKWYHKDFQNVGKADRLEDKQLISFISGVADAWKLIKPKLKSGDWIILEHLGNLWARVQDGFSDTVFQKDIGQYFLEQRLQLSSGAKRLDALKGWTDWSVINKMHNDDFIIPVCFENPAHVLMTTAVSQIQAGDRTEEQDLKAFYGDNLIRYEGQKHNIYRAQTILLFQAEGKAVNRKYYMSTFLKDRGRPWMERKDWYDFGYQYMVEVAGW